jgi:hypothetical protein
MEITAADCCSCYTADYIVWLGDCWDRSFDHADVFVAPPLES